MLRYVIDFIAEDGRPLAAYYKEKAPAELFFGQLHNRALAFYLENIIEENDVFYVASRVESYYPPEK